MGSDKEQIFGAELILAHTHNLDVESHKELTKQFLAHPDIDYFIAKVRAARKKALGSDIGYLNHQIRCAIGSNPNLKEFKDKRVARLVSDNMAWFKAIKDNYQISPEFKEIIRLRLRSKGSFL